MKTFVSEYYLQDAGGQSPYTPPESHCGGFDNYGLLVTLKTLHRPGLDVCTAVTHTRGTSPALLAGRDSSVRTPVGLGKVQHNLVTHMNVSFS